MMEGLLTFIITTTKETTQTKGGKVQIDKNKRLSHLKLEADLFLQLVTLFLALSLKIFGAGLTCANGGPLNISSNICDIFFREFKNFL